MWVCASFGILMPSLIPEQFLAPGETRTIQVRTRRKQDLEILREEFMGEDLGPTIHTPLMDYNYRAYCTPDAWGRAMFKMSIQIDYIKFKPTTEDKYEDKDLHDVYNSMWGTITRLGKPYEGVKSFGSSTKTAVKTYGGQKIKGRWKFPEDGLMDMWDDVQHMTLPVRIKYLYPNELSALKGYLKRKKIPWETVIPEEDKWDDEMIAKEFPSLAGLCGLGKKASKKS